MSRPCLRFVILVILYFPLFLTAKPIETRLDGDPFIKGTRTGNWTSLTCQTPAVEGVSQFLPQQRWEMLDCDNAWSDALNVWNTIDRPAKNLSFTQSIADTFHGQERALCDILLADDNCDSTIECSDTIGLGSGPAGYEVFNSLIVIHEIYKNYHDALLQMSGVLASGSQSFEDDFAPLPVPVDETGLKILLDLIGLGAVMVAAPFFNSILAKLPSFIDNPEPLGNLKDSSFAIIGTMVAIIKDTMGPDGLEQWTPEKQSKLSAYLGQVVWAWSNITEQTLSDLFDGTSTSNKVLTTLISDGKMITGSLAGKAPNGFGYPPPTPTDSGLQASILTAYYAYAIPAAWSFSGIPAFVLDSGHACSQDLDTSLIATCYQGITYYLAYPNGDPQSCIPGVGDSDTHCNQNDFSIPPGVSKLDGTAYGGITADILVQGSVNSYLKHGATNGGPGASISDTTTINDLYNQVIVTPGIFKIPVCSREVAIANWNAGNSKGSANYPCDAGLIGPIASPAPVVIHLVK